MRLQDLAPQDARLCLAMQAFVRHELGVDWRGKSLLLAFSGGADSTALLLMLRALRSQAQLHMAAAHLDHGLRPGSGAEADAARDVCARWDIPFYGERREVVALVREGEGLEEAGRRLRYEFLEETRARIEADWILTAHHAGDLAEDILLRLMRGASWPGLGGMPGRRGRLLRPILMLDKGDLLGLLRRQGVSWQEDESNQSRLFRRNRIRLDVMPLFLAENPNFLESARNLWRSARQDEEFWEETLAHVMPDVEIDVEREESVLLPRQSLLKLPKAGRMRSYAGAVRRLGKGQGRAATFFGLDDAVLSGRHGKLFQFSGNIQVLVEKKGVSFRKTPEKG